MSQYKESPFLFGLIELVFLSPIPLSLERGRYSLFKQRRMVFRQIFHRLLSCKISKSRVALAKEVGHKDRTPFRLSLPILSTSRFLSLGTLEEM